MSENQTQKAVSRPEQKDKQSGRPTAKKALTIFRRGGKAGKFDPQLEQRELIGDRLNFAASEAYKLLRTNLMFALPDEKKCRVVGLTSSVSGEGKSTTAINLAYSIAQTGKRVLIVEADMRLPTISEKLGLKRNQGLSNLLAGLSSGAEVMQPSGLHDNLWVITAGDIPPNPSELLGSEQMRVTIEVLGKDFDFILVDLPPVNAVSDPLIVSKLVSGMILVVRQDYSSRRLLSDAVRQLEFANAKVLGFVMTGATTGTKKYGKKNHYGYGYGYGRSSKAQ